MPCAYRSIRCGGVVWVVESSNWEAKLPTRPKRIYPSAFNLLSRATSNDYIFRQFDVQIHREFRD